MTTDSYDITGSETSRSGRAPTRESVEAALESLRGEYLQVPPAYSAKKVAGERAYARARRDEDVSLAPVSVRVARAEILEFSGATAHFGVTSSSGFYVRSFAHELGEKVGTGACLESLRRTRSGEFTIDRAVTLDQLQQRSAAVDERWIPLDRLLPGFPSACVSTDGRARVAHGQTLGPSALTGPPPAGADWVRLLDDEGQLVALATVDATGEVLHPAIVLI
jgi:tRNA pseudouridine55 synthase